MKVVIIGAGGHGREVLEILRSAPQDEPTPIVEGFVDDNPAIHGLSIDGAPVLGDWSWFDHRGRADIRVICAIGNPAVAHRLIQKARERGLVFANAISPTAHISSLAELGHGVVVFPNVSIGPGVRINNFATLNVASTISHDSWIGEYANINPGAHIAGNVTIGAGCYIGMGANIIQDIRIGAWSKIGAGAVVISDIPEQVTAVGVPATIVAPLPPTTRF